jgi:hypothetical protein
VKPGVPVQPELAKNRYVRVEFGEEGVTTALSLKDAPPQVPSGAQLPPKKVKGLGVRGTMVVEVEVAVRAWALGTLIPSENDAIKTMTIGNSSFRVCILIQTDL